VAYLGLNVADTPEEARAFVEEKGWDWPQIRDPERRLAKRIGADYQPFFAAVDENGEIVATHDGGADDAVWEGLLARLEDPPGG
jgi:hypothetical protein